MTAAGLAPAAEGGIAEELLRRPEIHYDLVAGVIGWGKMCIRDRLVGVVQGVEGVEELFLGGLLAGDELDIVHQQQVGDRKSVV